MQYNEKNISDMCPIEALDPSSFTCMHIKKPTVRRFKCYELFILIFLNVCRYIVDVKA